MNQRSTICLKCSSDEKEKTKDASKRMMLAGWVGGLVVGMVLAAGKRVKREPDDDSSRQSLSSEDDAPDDIEATPGPPRRKKKKIETKEEPDNNPDNVPAQKHECRFCNTLFDKSQALGGHMNRHRREREIEVLEKAKELLKLQAERRFGAALWNMQVGTQPGTLNLGGNMLPNMPLAGTSSKPYISSNQPTHQPARWESNQQLSSHQASYSLQSPSQGPAGSFYSSQDSTRPQAQGGHQQFHDNQAGQHQMSQRQVLQPGADFGSHDEGLFQMEQIGPLPLDDVMHGSNPNNAMTSFVPCTSQGNNIQFINPFATNHLLASNETHFQDAFQDGSQHNFMYDQRPGSLVMGGLDPNQGPAGGILHMPSFQDSTDHIQDDYQGGGSDGHIDAGVGLEDSSSDGKNTALMVNALGSMADE